jgi:hypothetical protein
MSKLAQRGSAPLTILLAIMGLDGMRAESFIHLRASRQ